MPIISNLTDRPVLLAFNSGQTLRLSPRSMSEEVPDVEIVNNAKVAKLAALNVITIVEPQQKRRASGADAGRSAERAAAAPASASAGTQADASATTKRESTSSSKSAKRP